MCWSVLATDENYKLPYIGAYYDLISVQHTISHMEDLILSNDEIQEFDLSSEENLWLVTNTVPNFSWYS